jgi:hypothetical protein
MLVVLNDCIGESRMNNMAKKKAAKKKKATKKKKI